MFKTKHRADVSSTFKEIKYIHMKKRHQGTTDIPTHFYFLEKYWNS